MLQALRTTCKFAHAVLITTREWVLTIHTSVQNLCIWFQLFTMF